MNKYHNIKRELDGHRFDSIAEMRMYSNLKLMESQGKISHLKLQVKYELMPAYINANGESIRPLTYVADFVFNDLEENRQRVIDCKGFKTAVYKIKKKLFDYKYKQFGLFLEEDIRRLRYG